MWWLATDCRRSSAGIRSGWAAVLLAFGLAGNAAEEATAFDAAPFATVLTTPGGTEYVLRWAEPRKIREVVVEGPDGVVVPADLHLSYWWKNWNGEADPLETETGVGTAGWGKSDDWTNGEWKEAAIIMQGGPSARTVRFQPTSPAELPDVTSAGVAYRRTLKLRLTSARVLPAGLKVHAYTDAVCRPVDVRIELGEPGRSEFRPSGPETIRLEAFNGWIESVAAGGALQPGASAGEWQLPAGADGVVNVRVWTATDPSSSRYDATILTLRAGARSCSFAMSDLATGDPMLVDDFGVMAVRQDNPRTLAATRARRVETGAQTIIARATAHEEQTLMGAWNDMPLKRPLNFVHGLPGNRNAMEQEAGGEIHIAAGAPWFTTQPSPRDGRKLWDEPRHFRLYFGFPGEPARGARELLEGYLPLLVTHWQEGPVHYEQRTVLDRLDGGDLAATRVDDPSVLLMRVRVVNTSADTSGLARLSLTAHGRTTKEKLYARGDRIMADFQGESCVRYLADIHGRGELRDTAEGVSWELELRPGEAHELDFRIPSVTPAGDADLEQLRRHDFDRDSRRVCAFWRGQTDRGMQIETPEPWLNNFHRAQIRHLLVNCFKDFTTDSLFAHVGTLTYGVYPNESVMMAAELDRRGYTDEARRALETFLRGQGTVRFLGNYAGQEGMFYGAAGHENGNYNTSHGYVLWGLAEHWRLTRDRAWMARVAPQIIAGCDWIIRERRATQQAGPDGTRPMEWGFLPRGSLEDVTDFWYWQATNSATAWGFAAAAAALADFGDPAAGRLQAAAADYRADVLRGVTESRVRSPVVRLRDGTAVPHFPSRLYQRGRSDGWVRETLEGALRLLTGGILPVQSPEAGWILNDYEDNLYISGSYGYAIPVFDRFWFSRGGFSMQANLLDGPPCYLERDEVGLFLRGYFNGLASGFYPDVCMFTEHALPELGYVKGDHFKSSDEAQSNYWLRLMFVREEGDRLYLGQAIPRYWMKDGGHAAITRAETTFGPMSLRLVSDVTHGSIRAELDAPARNPAQEILLRFRHPEGKRITSVTVDGRPYANFDPEREWVVLPGDLAGPREIIAHY